MDFFKEFGKQFSGKGRSGSEKTKDGTGLNRLNGELRDAEAALEQLYTRYGRLRYLERSGRGNPDAAEELALRIRAGELRLQELEAARDAALELKRCLNCGRVFAREARFCSACGKKLPEDAPKPEPVEVGEYCPGCGAKREGDEPRCPVCGMDFSAPAEPAARPDPADWESPAPEEPDGAMD